MFTSDEARAIYAKSRESLLVEFERAIMVASSTNRSTTLRCPSHFAQSDAEAVAEVFRAAPRRFDVHVDSNSDENYKSTTYYSLIVSW